MTVKTTTPARSAAPLADGYLDLPPASRERFDALVAQIHLESETGRRSLIELDRIATNEWDSIEPWFSLWQEHCARYFDLGAAEQALHCVVPAQVSRRLFLAQSYCALVLGRLAHALTGANLPKKRSSMYDWLHVISSPSINGIEVELAAQLAEFRELSRLNAVESSDLLATVYQELLPPPLRHLLGEYYTPSWLVNYCIKLACDRPSPAARESTIMDPAVGSGSFLAHYLALMGEEAVPPITRVVGFDVNPLAIEFCCANLHIASLKSCGGPTGKAPELSIHLADSVVDPTQSDVGSLFDRGGARRIHILGTTFEHDKIGATQIKAATLQFKCKPVILKAFSRLIGQYLEDHFAAIKPVHAQIVIGNPPWISWDGLIRSYRDQVAPQWAQSSLVTNTGWRAKVAAGKTDFSSLFVYRAVQRHAAVGGVMVFVLPLSLFQSRLSGAGFRSFRTSEGRDFGVESIDDFSEVRVFPDAVNRTSVGKFIVDRKVSYPVAYRIWAKSQEFPAKLARVERLGGALDPTDLSSPIIAYDEGRSSLSTVIGKSEYRARGGVNTGGANTILWVELLGVRGNYARVRNIGRSRRGSANVVEAEIEKEVVHPLLCGPAMDRWKTSPDRHIIMLYSANRPKHAIPEDEVRVRFPKAFDFVSRFRTELEARKEYHRWGCKGPFYELYRIGPYTFSPIKVVWQHTGYRKSLNVSVIDDRHRQLTVPDQKAILIPFQDLIEAHYACAFLASSVTANVLNRYLGTDASTHILDYVSLKRFDHKDRRHQKLAELSQEAHRKAIEGVSAEKIEAEIDGIVSLLVQKKTK